MSVWYSDLPTGWDVGRVKSIALRVTDGAHISPDTDGGAFHFVSTRDVKDGRIDFEGSLKTTPETYKYMVQTGCQPRSGDVLFSKDGTVGETAIVREDRKFVVASSLVIITPNQARMTPDFLGFVFASKTAKENAASMMRGAGLPRLSVGNLARVEVPIPPVGEQRAITEYLDRETSQIDSLIAEQEHLIDLLRERHEAVGAQFFSDSFGKRMTSVRRVLRPLARPAVSGLGVITAYRDGVVTLRSNRRDDGYTFSDTEHGYQEIRPGDLVFHALDGFAGAIGISDSHGNATPVYHVCETISGDDPAYVARLLRYLGVTGFLATQAPNVRERSVDFRNWSMLARIPLTLPTPTEQSLAVGEIVSQMAKIDTLIAESARFIELARERRSALITAAVTGQIDVRMVA